jgi:alanyl-tRNA synthetase
VIWQKRQIQKDGFKVVATKVEGVQNKDLADLMDKVRAKIGSGIVVLAIVEADKISVIAGVSKDLTAKFNAGNIIKDLCGKLGGKGGGRPDMARGGIGEVSDIQSLDNELQNIYNSF